MEMNSVLSASSNQTAITAEETKLIPVEPTNLTDDIRNKNETHSQNQTVPRDLCSRKINSNQQDTISWEENEKLNNVKLNETSSLASPQAMFTSFLPNNSDLLLPLNPIFDFPLPPSHQHVQLSQYRPVKNPSDSSLNLKPKFHLSMDHFSGSAEIEETREDKESSNPNKDETDEEQTTTSSSTTTSNFRSRSWWSAISSIFD